MRKKLWVVKIGSSLLTSDCLDIDIKIIHILATQIKFLKDNNIDVILVSSGAIASGMVAIGLKIKPANIHKLQALASIGQMDLVHSYQKIFKESKLQTSQILLTNEDLKDARRSNNITSTIQELFNLNVIPVVNENDTISFDEIKFGDNDNLAALLSNLLDCDKLIILTDQQGLFDKNPSKYKDAKLINEADKDSNLEKFATTEGSKVGTGGMLSKILSARVAKCVTHIVGIDNNILKDIFNNNFVGTTLK